MKTKTGYVFGSVFFAGMLALVLSGCVMRNYTLAQPRVDTVIKEGNRGYLMGTPPVDGGVSQELKQRHERLTDTRKIEVLEIEMPVSGNIALQSAAPAGEERAASVSVPSQMPAAVSKGEDVLFTEPPAPQNTMAEPSSHEEKPKDLSRAARETTSYTVQKGDTLQKISMKFYNTSKKWMYLYKANSDVLKGPDKLRPGQALKIPPLE